MGYLTKNVYIRFERKHACAAAKLKINLTWPYIHALVNKSAIEIKLKSVEWNLYEIEILL